MGAGLSLDQRSGARRADSDPLALDGPPVARAMHASGEGAFTSEAAVRIFPATPISLLALILFAGCAGNDMSPGQEALNSALRRVDEHEAVAVSAEDEAALRRETQAYGRDMHGFLDDMIAACTDMMDSMHAQPSMDMRELTKSADEAGVAIDQHADRMMQLSDVKAMQKECSEHRQKMMDMLDAMRGTMSRGGMMGGGDMMGRGGMMGPRPALPAS